MFRKLTAATIFAATLAVASGNVALANDSSLATDHWLASDVYGAGVYDRNDNKIGDVDDLVIKQDGTISQAVIGVGGFLGVGQKDVAVAFTDLKVKTKNDKSWLVLDTTKDKLKAAPKFDKSAYNK
jgi:sporulation protein YlmC with PRC-barrel domain